MLPMQTKSNTMQAVKKSRINFLLLNNGVKPKQNIYCPKKAKPEDYILPYQLGEIIEVNQKQNKQNANIDAAMEAPIKLMQLKDFQRASLVTIKLRKFKTFPCNMNPDAKIKEIQACLANQAKLRQINSASD